MTTMIRYRLKCTTENQFVYWNLLSTDPLPTTCSTNTAHTVDTLTLAKVKEVSNKMLQLIEEENPTNAKWRSKAMWVQGATGMNILTEQDFTWDHPVSVLSLQIRTTEENAGDYVELSVIPNLGFGEGVIGVLAATGISGATGISVSQNIVDAVYTIDYLSLKLGSTEQLLGYITSIDKENRILYFQTPLQENFPAGTTAIKLRRYVIGEDDFLLGPPDKYVLGATKLGSAYIPTNGIVRVGYKNKSDTSSKQMYSIIEYLE